MLVGEMVEAPGIELSGAVPENMSADGALAGTPSKPLGKFVPCQESSVQLGPRRRTSSRQPDGNGLDLSGDRTADRPRA